MQPSSSISKSSSTHTSEVSESIDSGSRKISTTTTRNNDIPSVSDSTENGELLSVETFQVEAEINPDTFAQEIDHLIDEAENIQHQEAEPIAHRVKERLDKMVKKLAKLADVEGEYAGVIGGALSPLDLVHDLFNEPFERFNDAFNVPGAAGINAIMGPMEKVRTALQSAEAIESGVMLVLICIQYNEAKELLKELKAQHKLLDADSPESVEIVKQMAILTSFIKVQKAEIKTRALNFSAAAGNVVLKNVAYMANLAASLFDAIKVPAKVMGKVVGVGLAIVDIVANAIQVWKTQKAMNVHEVWTEEIAKNPRDGQQALELLMRRQERMLMNQLGMDSDALEDIIAERQVAVKRKPNETDENYGIRARAKTLNKLCGDLFFPKELLPKDKERFILEKISSDDFNARIEVEMDELELEDDELLSQLRNRAKQIAIQKLLKELYPKIDLLAVKQEQVILNSGKITAEELQTKIENEAVALVREDGESRSAFKARIHRETLEQIYLELYPNDFENHDGMNASARKGLEALSKVKVKNEKGFFKLNRFTARFGLALAALSAALTITIEILAIAGVVALTASTMAMPFVGLVVLGLGLTIAGLIYFYKKKPNLFKCYVQGVQLRQCFLGIVANIRKLQLRNAVGASNKFDRKFSAREEELQGLKNQVKELLDNNEYELSVKPQKKVVQLEKKLKNDEKKREKLENRIEKIREKNAYWSGADGVITKLNERVSVAANKDFALANRLIKTAQGKHMNIPRVLARGLLYKQSELDDESIKILEEKMGVDVNELAGLGSKDKRAKLRQLLRNYFKMDDAELLTFMKDQLNSAERLYSI